MPIRNPLRSIQGVVIVAIVASGLVTAGIGYVTFDLVHHEMERQLDHRIELETDGLLAVYADEGLTGVIRDVKRRDQRLVPGRIGYLVGMRNESRMMAVFVADRAGRRLAGSVEAALPPPGWSEFVSIRRRDGSTGAAQAMNSVLPDGSQLVVLADRAILEEVGAHLQQIFLVGLGLILAVCAAAAFGIGRFVQLRLARIQHTAEAIMSGDMQHRIPRDHTGSEFDKLSHVLNTMLDRISALLTNLKQVSENIAHDMRTPLHRLRHRLEAAEQTEKDTVKGENLRRALEEADELLELFSSLLAISEIEGFRIRDRFVSLDLGEATRGIVEAYYPALKAANLKVVQQIHPAWVQGDRRLLQQCVANFLDNVLAHAKGASQVMISVQEAGGSVTLSVADNGSGVSAEDRKRIFERLVRLDQARSTPGHGLGLSLVSAIAAAHHGEAAASISNAGLKVQVAMPAIPAIPQSRSPPNPPLL